MLADRAAETYSRTGLLTKAQLLERRGNLEGALKIYDQVLERYSDGGAMIGFLGRAQKRSAGGPYGAMRDAAVRKFLPGGLKPFGAEISAPPKRGVIVHTENNAIRGAGLRRGDIVVAARGYQVDGWMAFKTIRGLEPEVPLVMRIWRDGAYQDLKPVSAGYRFGIDLSDYVAR